MYDTYHTYSHTYYTYIRLFYIAYASVFGTLALKCEFSLNQRPFRILYLYMAYLL